ncbi:MAG TPA: hypothetical protein VD971_02430 [Phycisphaerales bacterium]|nr:hypothetical protein [Phycisphaerales bacterium]
MWYLFTAIRCTGCGGTHDLAVPNGNGAAVLSDFEFLCPASGRLINISTLSVGAVRFEQYELPSGFIVARRSNGSTNGGHCAAC